MHVREKNKCIVTAYPTLKQKVEFSTYKGIISLKNVYNTTVNHNMSESTNPKNRTKTKTK